MLVEISSRKTHRREEFDLRDDATGRLFGLVHYYNGTDSEDVAEVMNLGKRGGWTSFEMHPNGRLISDDNKRVLDVPGFDKLSKSPSKTWAAVLKAEKENPGLFPVSWGGGRGCNTIYYDSREDAVRSIENALLTDTWVIESEPIRQKQLNPKCRIDLGADAILSKAAGKGQILAAIRDLTDMLAKNETIRVSERFGGVRIQVERAGLEYPDNLRLMLDYGVDGRVPAEGHAFSRKPYYDVADSLAGRDVPRYDMMAARGLPPYGMRMAEPAPAGALCVRCLYNNFGTSNKIYAHIAIYGEDYAVWGRFDKGAFSASRLSYSEITERTWKKRGERYEEVNEEVVPDFWERAVKAIDKKRLAA